jgi:hypothetical protein
MTDMLPMIVSLADGPVPTGSWYPLTAAAAAVLIAVGTLWWVATARPTMQEQRSFDEQNQRLIEDAVRRQLQQAKERQLAGDVDGWVEPVVELSGRRTTQSGVLETAPPDGWQLPGCVVNRTGTPIWDVVVDLIDAQSEHSLPFPALFRPRLDPGSKWRFDWFCGSAFTAYYEDATVPPGDATQLPAPHAVIGAGASRPQLRVTFTDTAGRWVHTGSVLARTALTLALPPGIAPFSRAIEDLSRMEAGTGTSYASLVSELALALQDAARGRLQPLSTDVIQVAQVSQLLAGDHYIYRIHLDRGTGDGNGATAGALRILAGGFHELALRLELERRQAEHGIATEDQLLRARQLVAKTCSALTTLDAVRINAPILASGRFPHGG